jgi:hypothetical protein
MRRMLALLLVACSSEPSIVAERTPRTVAPDRALLATPKTGMLVREPQPVAECEEGESRQCWVEEAVPFARMIHRQMHCQRMEDGTVRWSKGECYTPLALVFDPDPVEFTRPSGTFAIGGVSRTQWIGPKTPWLGLDRDGSGCVESESELFGPSAYGDDGFATLAAFDDDGNGLIDARDAVFERLLLWSDADQDRRCTPLEVLSLREAGVRSLSLAAQKGPPSPSSYEGLIAPMEHARGTGRIVDVFLAPMD